MRARRHTHTHTHTHTHAPRHRQPAVSLAAKVGNQLGTHSPGAVWAPHLQVQTHERKNAGCCPTSQLKGASSACAQRGDRPHLGQGVKAALQAVAKVRLLILLSGQRDHMRRDSWGGGGSGGTGGRGSTATASGPSALGLHASFGTALDGVTRQPGVQHCGVCPLTSSCQHSCCSCHGSGSSGNRAGRCKGGSRRCHHFRRHGKRPATWESHGSVLSLGAPSVGPARHVQRQG